MPYDAMLVNGSVEVVPEALLSQLAEGGRIGAVTRNGKSSRATIYTRVAGSVASRPVFDAAVPPLPGFAAPKTFVF